MTEKELKKVLGIDDDKYNRLINLIIENDKIAGSHLMETPGLLFNISLYSLYPILFSGIFSIEKYLNDIILFSRYYSGWLFILDKIYDGGIDEKDNKLELLVMSTCLSEAEHQLQKIVPVGDYEAQRTLSKFRKISDVNMKREYTFYSYNRTFNDRELHEYCINKYALAKSVVYICYLCDGNGKTEMLNKLFLSHDYFAIARQLLDEIEDYEEDYSIGKFNIYANKMLEKYGEVINENTVKNELMLNVRDYMENALVCIKDIPECGWTRFLQLNNNKF